MVARLVAEEGELKGLVLSFEDGDSWVIGRDPEACQLVIEDPLASRRHLIARRTPEGISVENLSTTNPIQVNEEQVNNNESRVLQNGDTVKIGNETFRYYVDTSAHLVDVEEAAPNGTQTSLPTQTPPPPPPANPDEEEHDTIFDGEPEEAPPLADINFGLAETGRWLLKVIGGPNNGAEFYMQTGHDYVIGTDPHSCDIVFHDTSVSRQHARVQITDEDTLFIEDLKSRNGVLVSGEKLEGKKSLSPSVIVTMGTTSFVVYDREGEMQTIISPLLPSIVKVLQQDEASKQEITPTAEEKALAKEIDAPIAPQPVKAPRSWGPLILLVIITGIFGLMSIATYSLFKAEPIVQVVQENAGELIQQVMAPFPAVKYAYNKNNNSLLLLGHVATAADKNQLMYGLQNLDFIKTIDDSGLIIDEFVWREINSVISRNPGWQGISIHSPAAGEFILSGYLQNKKQAEQLSDYISVNFPYLDLLKNQVVVEEDVVSLVNNWLTQENLRDVTARMTNGEVILSGTVSKDKVDELSRITQKIRDIQGVRSISNLTKTQAPSMDIINISDQYSVTGQSKVGSKLTVVVNGRILSEGDVIDGMTITKIVPNTIFLEREDSKFRIDY